MSVRALLIVCLMALTLAGTCVSPAPPAPASPSPTPVRQPPMPAMPIAWQMPARAACAAGYAAPVERGRLGDKRLLEASGVVASPAQPGVLWMHNDSGDAARLYAVGTDGRALAALTLPNVDAVDIEDIAAAPCPDLSGPCLYVADTGDNKLKREQLVVYAVPEPAIAVDGVPAKDGEAPFVWIFPLVIPERANIEALVVLPDASAMVLFEKTESEQARVFRYAAPWTPLTPATVEVTAKVAVPAGVGGLRQITGADLHPSGTHLLVRGYGAVWETRLDPAVGVTLDNLDRVVWTEVITAPDEPQGEAVAYDGTGTGIVTVSESPSGDPGPPLHFAPCAATP
ncbi:MAG: hypothetical protein A2138_07725 [Deltaproteobacteria bacterium RBG_16_71_12]|nr:MAG: hypothetical protein A2138_07725 [Deltaproteobacteria bacterium RBG_16_71_12]